MRSAFCGVALLFAGCVLAGSASAGNSGHFGGFGLSPSFHRGFSGHNVVGAPQRQLELRRDDGIRRMGFDRLRAGERRFGFDRWPNGGYDLRVRRGYNGAGDFFGFPSGFFYGGPTTANETAAAPIMVIVAPVYVPVAPVQTAVSSGPRIIVIGTKRTARLPRVTYGTPPQYPSM